MALESRNQGLVECATLLEQAGLWESETGLGYRLRRYRSGVHVQVVS